MNLILTSIDGNIFDEGSYVRKRMLEYVNVCEQLEIVCVTNRTDARDIQLSDSARIHAITVPKIFAPFVLFWRLLALIQEAGPEETVLSSQDPFFLGLISLAASCVAGVPLHTQVHVAFFSPWYKKEGMKQRFLSHLAGYVLTRSSRIRTVSQKITDYCSETLNLPKSKIDTIPLLVDLQKIHAERETPLSPSTDLRTLYPQFGSVVLIACRLTKQKNIPRALRAFKAVLEYIPDAGLVLVGRGEEEEQIKHAIQELGIEKSVALIPWSNDVPSFMKSADVFLISSDYEGYVMTAMEASACGLPIVMTNVGGAGEFVHDGENGLVVAVEDETGLTGALIRVLTDEILHAELSAGGVQAAAVLPSFSEYRALLARSWEKTLKPSSLKQESRIPESGTRILFITQTVDRTDLPLSFTHDWIEALSKEFTRMIVIALNKGNYDLPGVEVLSLGKESGKGRLTYLVRFFSYIWKNRYEYDAVFVHMNQEYVLLAGLFWRIMGKRVYLWRNHYAGSWKTDLAAAFCTKVFCTSRYSYTAKYKKTVFMPVGVDIRRFFPDDRISRTPRSILFFARMSPAKRPDLFIEALGLLLSKGVSFVASVYGSPYPTDVSYYESLKARAESLGLHDRVRFYPGVSNDKAADIFRAHEIFVNCSPSGMFDKMLFEAAACDALVVASSKDFHRLTNSDDFYFIADDAGSLAARLSYLLNIPETETIQARAILREISEKNSLDTLIIALKKELAN